MTLCILFSRSSVSNRLCLIILVCVLSKEHDIKERREGELIYLISIAFFLALRVEDNPDLGISHISIAFCLSNFVLSVSFKAKSHSTVFYVNFNFTWIFLFVYVNYTRKQWMRWLWRKHFLYFEPCLTFYQEFHVISGKKIRQECFLVNNLHKGAH